MGGTISPKDMTPKHALRFVETNGVALESARGPVPSLAQTIAGKEIRGSWWAHPKGRIIFACSRAIRNSKDVLTCRLVEGKVTYVHRRLWPALARLSERFTPPRLAAIREAHSPEGTHKIEAVAFPEWVPSKEMRKARKLSIEQAIALLESAGVKQSR